MMADDRITLRTFLEKASYSAFVRKIISFVAERILAPDSETLCRASPGERTAERVSERNGYYDKDW
jgi:transposase-like protein